MRRRDLSKLLVVCAVAPAAAPWKAWAQSCAAGNNQPTPAEVSAGVKVIDASRCPGDWRRYGADPSGRTDSTAAIQAACRANQLAFDGGGTYLVSAQIVVPSGVSVRGAGAAATQIVCANGDTSILMASGASGVAVQGIKFVTTAVSVKAHTGAVAFVKSTKCSCSQCEIVGSNWAG